MIGWFMGLSKGQRGGVVYGLILLGWLNGLELPAHYVKNFPIPTLTGTIRDAIKWWHVLGLLILFFFAVLWAHFDRGWSAVYLIVTAVLILVAVGVHAIAP